MEVGIFVFAVSRGTNREEEQAEKRKTGGAKGKRTGQEDWDSEKACVIKQEGVKKKNTGDDVDHVEDDVSEVGVDIGKDFEGALEDSEELCGDTIDDPELLIALLISAAMRVDDGGLWGMGVV
ncbi:hypothetical protein Ancab_024190 [Ancistrocladus abbreviatus]